MRFCRIADELQALCDDDPAFEPAWPAATNPVMNPPIKDSVDRVHVDHPANARWLDIGNALYTTSLRCLLQGLGETERRAKATWLGVSFAVMRMLVPVGEGLAARPAHADASQPHAGLTFTPLRTLVALPPGQAASVVVERLGQLRARAMALPLDLVAGERPADWQGVIDLLAQQQSALMGLAGITPPMPAAPLAAAPAPAPAPTSPAPAVEVARGRELTVLFEGRRCIHSRHCVLDAPTVFKANTPGEWIYPDTPRAEALVAVAHSCPSGAIRY
ncbi:MAG: (4Fe-4S)-binding protein [Rubrivivax sp.]|nr:(4Fe-4S)-binding protein [Rubrivivax sp.]